MANAAGGRRPGDVLRGSSELHVVVVCTHFLRLCRELRGSLDEALQKRWAAGFKAYFDEGQRLLVDAQSSLDEEYLHEGQLVAIADFLDEASNEHDLALRASDLAQVLDERRGTHFFSWFAGREHEAAANDPFPIPPADVAAEEMGSERGLPPQADTLEVPRVLPAPLDGTLRLRLVPIDVGRFRINLDARHHGVVDALFSGTRVAAPGPDVVWAAAIPSCAILDDLTYDVVDHIDPPGFYGVRPKPTSAATYLGRLLELLAIAAAEGASIITLPELSTDEAIENAVVQWFSENPKVALLIAGSRHLAGDTRRNRARVLIRGLSPNEQLVHDKFSSFSITLDGVVRDEWIERPTTLTIVAGRRWSFSTLICKDFMEIVPRRVLADLRVRAVFVASMSPKTDLYVTSAAAMAQDSQALVFISNAPHGPRDDIAILAQPRRGPVIKTADQQPNGITALTTTAGDKFRTVRLA